ncbi:hypothetical protein [Flavobacterium panici]|uniref:Uncharacterized protein n=1 Tax=Flavobacterium panici TaxID=2654843 RepID=A0A9N8IYK3_9FLAO|nr:hypothetical protein [Flavobacterium panici]CAC9972921.1 hypothetical protein FLAPXU55_00600 [Flavobacterium panici]
MPRVTDRIYRTKNDIPYLPLCKFSEDIKGNETDIELIKRKVKEYFKTTDLDAFNKAMHTDPKRVKFRYKYDGDLSVIDKFIDVDTFQRENDFEALLKILLKPKYKLIPVDVNKVSLAEVEVITKSFL